MNIDPEPISVAGVVDSVADPENLKSSLDVSDVDATSAADTKENIDPEPT